MPAARLRFVPGAARTDVTALAVFSTDLPAKLSVTLTFPQYLASAFAATLCTWIGGGGSARRPRLATPVLGRLCARPTASSSAAAARSSSFLLYSARSSSDVSYSDSSSLVSDAVDDSESPAPAGPESFFGANAAISTPRPTPGGGDASRMGCVWWNAKPLGLRRCISPSMSWHACLSTRVS